MDDRSFDALTRRLGAGATRRAGLKAALGGLLGLSLAAPLAGGAQAKHHVHKKKRSARCSPDKPCPEGQTCDGEGTSNARCMCDGGSRPCGTVCCPAGQQCDGAAENPVCRCTADGQAPCNGACCAPGESCFAGACRVPPFVCPSGTSLVDGACACTRALCGEACCAGNESCRDGRCVETGLRDCTAAANDGRPKVGEDLSYCRLRGVKWGTSTGDRWPFRNVNFEGADLSGAYLQRKNLRGCSFRNALMQRVDLRECDIADGTSFAGANLLNTWLRGSHINGADLSGANLSGVDLLGTPIADTSLAGALLTDADLGKARFDNVDFSRCALGRASFADSALNGGVVFAGADLTGASFRSATLTDVDLAGAALDGVDLRGATATRTDFHGAHCAGADLRGFQALRSDFGGTDLRNVAVGVDLESRSSRPTQFEESDMGGARIDVRSTDVPRPIPGSITEPIAMRFAGIDLRQSQLGGMDPVSRFAWISVDLRGATVATPIWTTTNYPGENWCWNLLPDGARSTNPDCRCRAGGDACFPAA